MHNNIARGQNTHTNHMELVAIQLIEHNCISSQADAKRAEPCTHTQVILQECEFVLGHKAR